MKIELVNQDLKKLINLLHVREINMDVSSMYLYYLLNEANSIKEKNVLNYVKKRNLSLDRAFYYEFLNVLELDYKDPDFILANKTCRIQNIKELKIDKYINNPYYRMIKVPETTSESWYFKYDTIEAYEGFMYKDLEVIPNENYAEISSLGFFSHPYKYLSVTQGDEIWMCVTPHEMETMEASIEEARGNVLVFGLGLGYYPFMISRKSNVNKITIIEKDKNAIELFTKYILPQFPNKDKITIIQDDAFEFIKDIELNKRFNYAFVDLWHNVDDGISMYLQMKKLELPLKNIHFSYWIENSLIVYLRRLLLTLIDEQADGSTEENYKIEENIDDFIVNKMYHLFKDLTITSFDQIIDLLSDESLKDIASKIY